MTAQVRANKLWLSILTFVFQMAAELLPEAAAPAV